VEGGDIVEAKRRVRQAMRAVRRELSDQGERSELICGHLRDLEPVRRARTVMAFVPVPGEPDLATFVTWCRGEGKTVVVPEPSPTAPPPADPATVDVVLVPGVAFTAGGLRLGQGGGWYDRYLALLRDDAVAIGVCFEPQLVDDLPTEEHDAVLDLVITDAGVAVDGEPER
jgi:5-formyltetrahydrofolate cyclo-ligase